MRRSTHVAVLALALASCAGPGPGYSGTVQTESVAVGSRLGGRVAETDVAAGSAVHRGSVILRIDSAPLEAQYQQTVAQTRAAAERLNELLAGSLATDIARARAQSAQAAAQYRQTVSQAPPQTAAAAMAIRDAQAAVRLTHVTLERMQSLAATGDVARQTLDQAQSEDQRAQAQLAQARANYAALVNAALPGQRAAAQANAAAQSAAEQTVRNGPRPEDIAQARSQLAAARAAENFARAQLAETIVVAPADGIVESFNLHPGDLLAADQQAAIVDEFADPYTYIYVSQRDLGGLARGKHLRVRSDADNAVYDGVVEAQDRTAQFTPQNVETADQRAELVYGVKVRIHDPQHRLLSGTTVTARPA